MSGAEQQDEKKWTYSVRVIPNVLNRARWRNTLTYRLHPRLTAGLEFNPLAKDVRPLANWLVVQETRKTPALIIGTSSDRIGTPSGQSFYGTVSKHLRREIRLPIAPYVGVTYGTYEHRVRMIGGLNVQWTGRVSSTVIFDGVHVHPLLSVTHGQHAFSFILVRGRQPGVSYSISF